MAKIFKKMTKKVGLPPGSLIHIGNFVHTRSQMSILQYNEDTAEEIINPTSQSLDHLNPNLNAWVMVKGIHNTQIVTEIGQHFHLHPLLLEDIVNSDQRAKLDDYKETLFIVMRFLHYNEKKRTIEDEQISLVLGKNFLISFQETGKDLFGPILNRYKKPGNIWIGYGVDRLCYSVVDFLVDQYFEILEKIDSDVEFLDEELMKHPSNATLFKIQKFKREMTYLRKVIWPAREVVGKFIRLETPLIQASTKIWINDVYDHVIRAIDTIETFRDIAAGMMDLYISNINLRMNEIIKVLTIITTIFVPLTFISSLYGMNFDYMPELHYHYGYFLVLASMLVLTIGMLVFFRKKHWI